MLIQDRRGTRDVILLKAGALTEEECALMKRHFAVGARSRAQRPRRPI
jgi:HD-GYP domain-containing protein (c-di-GMP phosphodiesterase class II)